MIGSWVIVSEISQLCYFTLFSFGDLSIAALFENETDLKVQIAT